ncbi:response regulator [Salinarimonas rosea]|uniref:response regulator n=1 Tax=Salinarimonas rosea TaxID=552063 RepID=UPI0004126F5B|nr:response regulator [Salinarimonas rosea]
MQTVLVVDADVIVRHNLAEFLRDCGLKVVEASSAVEARTFLAETTLGIDIALVDARLPGPENAFALRAWIASTHPDIAVVLAGSLETAVDEASEICEQGPTLPKPYDPKSVLDRIKRLRAERDRG